MAQARKLPPIRGEDLLGFGAVVGHFTTGSYDYLRELYSHELLKGKDGARYINPKVKPLIEAMHQVLAGGEAKVTINQSGNLPTVKCLNEQLALSLKETNAANKRAGGILKVWP